MAGFRFPMRPSVPRQLPATPHEFLVQGKYDGWNVVIADGHVWTRHGNDITGWCARWGFDAGPPWPVNGELLAVDDDGVAARTDIQGIRTGRCRPHVVAFDLMLEGVPIDERLQRLHELLGIPSPAVLGLQAWAAHMAITPDAGAAALSAAPTADPALENSTWADLNRCLDAAHAAGREGLMLKRKGSAYHVSREVSIVTEDWLKMKVRAG